LVQKRMKKCEGLEVGYGAIMAEAE
jgi:hypothetical protein